MPWVDRPIDVPVETTITTTPNAPDCGPGVLSIVDAGGGGAGGTLYFHVTLKNSAGSRCTLHSVTAASALDHSGRRAALSVSASPADGFHIAPSGFVNVMLATPDACGPNHDQGPTLSYSAVWISLRAVQLTVPQLQLTACGNDFSTYFEAYSPPARLPAPGTMEAISATIEPDYHVTNGFLEYVVALRNPTNAVFPLDVCAVYTESFASTNPSAYVNRRYELNCATIHQIGPHAAVRYAMRLAIPSTARSGKLDWQLGAGQPATAIEIRL